MHYKNAATSAIDLSVLVILRRVATKRVSHASEIQVHQIDDTQPRRFASPDQRRPSVSYRSIDCDHFGMRDCNTRNATISRLQLPEIVLQEGVRLHRRGPGQPTINQHLHVSVIVGYRA